MAKNLRRRPLKPSSNRAKEEFKFFDSAFKFIQGLARARVEDISADPRSRLTQNSHALSAGGRYRMRSGRIHQNSNIASVGKSVSRLSVTADVRFSRVTRERGPL